MHQNRGITDNNYSVQDTKIRSAIDLLLSSDATEIDEFDIKLTECSPDIDVVINKQGGICTKCNSMFKSRPSLNNHIKSCYNNNNNNSNSNINNISSNVNNNNNIKVSRPRIVIVPH